ncbi:MAG TPA: hypothetical protein VNK46_07840 [Nitrospiraceae bacterium]|nr:hypothetical protein [Nitrospiraceae bacterium]
MRTMDAREPFHVHTRRAVWTLSALLWLIPHPVAADPFLSRLDCVSVQASVWEVGDSFGITTDVLREAIRAGLRTHAPRLKIEPGCPDRIDCKVFLQDASTDTFKGFFGHIAIEVTRKAVFQDTALLTAGRAWDLQSYVFGTRDKAKTSVLDQLNRHLAQFAADYLLANRKEDQPEESKPGNGGASAETR